jgi:hypothetical protein
MHKQRIQKIKLRENCYAIIDYEDYDLVSPYTWRADSKGYAVSTICLGGKKTIGIKMHRIIIRASDGKQVDHINKNTLDNRKCNLRICTPFQNSGNQSKQKNNTSGYKGVTYYKSLQKWQAGIQINGRSIHLGRFENKEDAARAYNEAATKYFGEFAQLNVILNG